MTQARTDRQMMNALNHLPPDRNRVHLGDCQFCGTPVVIAAVPKSARPALPPTPNKSAWRAFERRWVRSADAWRSSKRFGFVPAREGEGFLPHACPIGDGVSEPEGE